MRLPAETSEQDSGPLVSMQSISREDICSPVSGADWKKVTVRSSDGCLFVDEAGLVFVEWREAGRSFHVESADMARNALLDYLETWALLRP